MSYKSDAVDLIANAIDKETGVTTPAGEQLNVDDSEVEEVRKNVNTETASSEQQDSTEQPATDSSNGE